MIELTPHLLNGVTGGYEEEMIGRGISFEKADRAVEEEEKEEVIVRIEESDDKLPSTRSDAPSLPGDENAVAHSVSEAEKASVADTFEVEFADACAELAAIPAFGDSLMPDHADDHDSFF